MIKSENTFIFIEKLSWEKKEAFKGAILSLTNETYSSHFLLKAVVPFEKAQLELEKDFIVIKIRNATKYAFGFSEYPINENLRLTKNFPEILYIKPQYLDLGTLLALYTSEGSFLYIPKSALLKEILKRIYLIYSTVAIFFFMVFIGFYKSFHFEKFFIRAIGFLTISSILFISLQKFPYNLLALLPFFLIGGYFLSETYLIFHKK
jgi:hypothetical protein